MIEYQIYLWYTSQSDDPDAFVKLWVPGNVSVDMVIMLTMIAMQKKFVFSASVGIPSDPGMITYTRSAVVLWGAEMLDYRLDQHSF